MFNEIELLKSESPEKEKYLPQKMRKLCDEGNEKTKKYVLWAKTVSKGKGFRFAKFSICIGDTLHSLKYVETIDMQPHFWGDFDLFKDGDKAYVVFEFPHSEMIVRELNEEYTNQKLFRRKHLRGQLRLVTHYV